MARGKAGIQLRTWEEVRSWAGGRGSYPVVAPSDWPDGHRIAFAHEGATWAAAQLCKIAGFDPVLMRVTGMERPKDKQAPGEYLLLPLAQEAAWRKAERRHGGRLRPVVADLAAGGSRVVEQAIEGQRRAAKIVLREADCHVSGEVAAFDVVVNGCLIGRWAQTAGGRGSVTWTDGLKVETDSWDGDHRKLVDALRSSVPVPPKRANSQTRRALSPTESKA